MRRTASARMRRLSETWRASRDGILCGERAIVSCEEERESRHHTKRHTRTKFAVRGQSGRSQGTPRARASEAAATTTTHNFHRCLQHPLRPHRSGKRSRRSSSGCSFSSVARSSSAAAVSDRIASTIPPTDDVVVDVICRVRPPAKRPTRRTRRMRWFWQDRVLNFSAVEKPSGGWKPK